MTYIPNLITLFRLLSAPLIIWLMLHDAWRISLYIFMACAFSDMADGFLARLWRVETKLGAYLDPIADKFLLISMFIILSLEGAVPFWFVAIVVGRDMLITGGVMLAHILSRPMTIRSHWSGKINTAIQFTLATIILTFMSFNLSDYLDGFFVVNVFVIYFSLIFISAVFTLFSIIPYLYGFSHPVRSRDKRALT